MPSNLLVRADAGPDIGMGHVMRCLAVAQAWQDDGGTVTFAMARGFDVFEQRLARERIVLERSRFSPGSGDDIRATVDLAKQTSSVVLLDAYVFGVEFQAAVARAGLRCGVIDDHRRLEHYEADVVVDANATATVTAYKPHAPDAQILAGLNYALIRREFRRSQPLPSRSGSRILLSFGGADPHRLTERALHALHPNQEARVLVGASNPNLGDVERAAERLPKARVLYDSLDVPDDMAWASLALAAAGSTCAELAFMGLPAIVVVAAENQMEVARGFEALGTVRVLGDATRVTAADMAGAVDDLISDEPSRNEMARLGRAAVDGRGAVRVAQTLREGLR